MEDDRLAPLLSQEQIASIVEDLADQISRDYGQRELVLVCVLKGAFMFLSDLIRHLRVPVQIDFVRLASYGPSLRTSGRVEITKDIEISIEGKDVLIVEDIIDTGVTLKYLYRRLKARRPRSLKSVVLLDKPSRRKVRFQPDYVGFTIEDHFVVGYGLDFNEDYRNLPGIYVLK